MKLANASGISSAFYRMFFGTVFLLPIWLYRKKFLINKKGLVISASSGVLFAIDIYFWNESILVSKFSISTLFANVSPIWVGLYAAFFSKNKPSSLFWIGTIVAFLGMIILSGISFTDISLSKGVSYAVISSEYFYAAYILIVKDGVNNSDTLTFTFVSIFSSTITLAKIGVFSHSQFFGFSTISWVYLALLGLVPQVFGWYLINNTLSKITPAAGSLILLLQTVFTALIAYPLLDERLNMSEIYGLFIVLFGVSLITIKR